MGRQCALLEGTARQSWEARLGASVLLEREYMPTPVARRTRSSRRSSVLDARPDQTVVDDEVILYVPACVLCSVI